MSETPKPDAGRVEQLRHDAVAALHCLRRLDAVETLCHLALSLTEQPLTAVSIPKLFSGDNLKDAHRQASTLFYQLTDEAVITQVYRKATLLVTDLKYDADGYLSLYTKGLPMPDGSRLFPTGFERILITSYRTDFRWTRSGMFSIELETVHHGYDRNASHPEQSSWMQRLLIAMHITARDRALLGTLASSDAGFAGTPVLICADWSIASREEFIRLISFLKRTEHIFPNRQCR